MIPRFRLERPTTLEAALDAQARAPDDTAYLAGGTELLQVMKMGLTEFACLIDLKGLPGLAGIAVGPDGALEIGALATHREIERSALVATHLPELVALEHRVANPRVRATGTIGGNLAFAEPHSDPATFLVACGALVDLVGTAGSRSLLVDRFVMGPLSTVRRPDEILRGVRIPAAEPGEGRAYERIAFYERPTTSVAVAATVRDGQVVRATVVVGSVTDVPTRLPAVEMALAGVALTDLADAIRALRRDPPDEIDAFGDHTGSADYKRHLTWELVTRATFRAAGLAA